MLNARFCMLLATLGGVAHGQQTLVPGDAITVTGQAPGSQKNWVITVGKGGGSLKVELDRVGSTGDPILQMKKSQVPTLKEEDGRPVSDADFWDEQNWNDAMDHMEVQATTTKLTPGKYVIGVYNWEYFWPPEQNDLSFTLKATLEEDDDEAAPSGDSDEVQKLKATIKDLRAQINGSSDIQPPAGNKKGDPSYRLWYVAGKATCRGKTTITLPGNATMDKKNPPCISRPSNVTVRWANPKKPGLKDWVGLYEKDEADAHKYIIYYWVRAANSTEGSAIFYWKKPANWWKWLSARLEPGTKYNFRFFENAGWESKSKTPSFEVADSCAAKADASGKDGPKFQKKPKPTPAANAAEKVVSQQAVQEVKLAAAEAVDITTDGREGADAQDQALLVSNTHTRISAI